MSEMQVSSLSSAEHLHIPSGEGQAFWGPGDRCTFLVTGRGNSGGCFIVHCIVAPSGGPPHIHHREDEFFYLLEGELSVTVGDHTVQISKGNFVTAPRGVVHTYRDVGADNAQMLAVFTPAGMEGWFQDALDPAGDQCGLAPPPTAELNARMLAAGPKHGVEWA